MQTAISMALKRDGIVFFFFDKNLAQFMKQTERTPKRMEATETS